MKKLITLGLILTGVVSYGQSEKINEKQAIEKSTIDLTSEYIYFTISNDVEIDGHIYKNKDRECPLMYTATADYVHIIDSCSSAIYETKNCYQKNCKVLHLRSSDWSSSLRGWEEIRTYVPGMNYSIED